MLTIFKQKQTAFSLDLSDISMKIVQLEKKSKGYKVLAYSDHPIPKGIIINDSIMDEAKIVEHIYTTMGKLDFGGVNTKQIIASIPESKAFVRVIQIPKMSEEQAAQAVPFESEQYIPIPIDQTYLDWEIIATKEDKMDVLVTASPKDYIDNYLRVLKNADLRPIAFEVESAACVRALISTERKDKAVLILDMNTYRTSLILVEQGRLQFTSSVPIAGDAFTQSIARGLSVSAEEAEKIKRAVGLDDSKEHAGVKQTLVPVVDNLVAEVRNIIKFHNEHSTMPISQIILCGGSAKLLNLSSYLYQKLIDYDQIDIILGNPWVNVFDGSTKNQISLSREDSLSFTTAIGLAMRGAEIK